MTEGAPRTALRNIDEVVALEQAAADERNPAERVADWVAARVGTLAFGAAHAVLIVVYALLNSGAVPGVAAFDPFPFGLLGTVLSLEGVLLASFLLIKQNRLGARADQRAHLDLQVSLLAEQEITKIIQMLDRLTMQLDIPRAAVVDAESEEMGEVTAVADLARHLNQRLPDAAPN